MGPGFDERQKKAWENTTNLRPYDHPVVQSYASQRVNCLKSLLGSWKAERALDVGCGDGFGMHHMQPIAKAIYGCDRSPRMLEANPARSEFLKQCDAYELPYEDGEFDLAYCWELLHHIRIPLSVVKEMTRVSSRCVVLCEPNSLNPAMAMFGIVTPHERGLLRFTAGYSKRLLKQAGLKNITQVSCGWFTPNRTPEWLEQFLSKLPYRVPIVGMYTITIGFKEAT